MSKLPRPEDAGGDHPGRVRAVVEAFEAATVAAQNAPTKSQIAAALVTGDASVLVEPYVRTLPGATPAAGAAEVEAFRTVLAANATEVFVEAGAAEMAGITGALTFDLENPYASAFAKEFAATRVTRIDDATRLAIRQTIAENVTSEIPTAQAVKRIRACIGLTPKQAEHVQRFAARMAAQVEAGELKQSVADKKVERAAAKKLRERAVMIARTEVIEAENAGTQASWDVAKSFGYLDANDKQEWIASVGSERTCPTCGELDGQKVPLNAPFVHPDGRTFTRPPAHPRCRCGVALEIGD